MKKEIKQSISQSEQVQIKDKVKKRWMKPSIEEIEIKLINYLWREPMAT